MPGSASARSWIRRAVLGFAAVALLVFGLRANGNTAAELVTNDAMVWLANPPLGTVVQVHGRSRDVAETVKVTERSDSLVARQLGTGAIVLDQDEATIGRIDGASLQYTAGRQVGTSGADLAIAVGAQQPYVIDTAAGNIEALDAKSLDSIANASITPQQAAVAVVGADGRLWAYDRETGEVLGMAPTGEVSRTKVTDPGTPAALALADSRPVLVEPTLGQVRRLGGSGKPGASACLASSGSEKILVAGSGGGAPDPLVFTIFADTGELSTSDLDDGSCVRLQLRSEDASGDDVYGQPVALGQILFVPVLNRGQVLVIDGARNTIERTITNLVTPNHRFELFVDDGNVWFNDLEGAAAGVLSPSGIVFTIDKDTASSRTGIGQGVGPGIGSDPDGEIVDNDPNAGTDAPGEGGSNAGSGTGGNGTSGDGDGGGNANGTGNGRGQGRGSDTGNAASDTGAQTPADSPGASPANDGLPQLPQPQLNGSQAPGTPAPAAPPGVLPPQPQGPTPAPQPTVPGPSTPTTPPPVDTLVANFSWSPAGQPDVNTTLDFVDTSVGRVTQWVWSFTGPDGSSTTAQGQRVSRTLPLAGNWSVTLTVTNGTRVDTTRPALIAVREAGAPTPPVADFTWEPQTPVVDTPVVFRDRSTSLGVSGGIVSWLWDFGDGTTATVQNPPSKVYTKADTYIVRLTVRNALRLEARAEVRIVVAAKPEPLKPDFSFSPAAPRVGDTVEFRDTTVGGPTSWLWDLGDGTTARTQNVSIRYRDQGDFKVTLTVRNERGTELVQKTVRVGAAVNAPQARISQPSGTATVEVGKSLRFVSGSTGAPTRLVWDFGDESARVEGNSVDKTWNRVGRYTVTLTASNDVGSTSTSMDVEVTTSQPVAIQAAFRVSPGATRNDPATVESPVLFTNTSSGQGTFSWNFGDGSPASTQTQPTHTYSSRGNYTVTLTMTNGDRVSTAQQDVFVVERVVRPRAQFSFSPQSPAVGQTITFTDQSQNTPTTWSWDFGDGSSNRSEQNPTKVYANPGTYFVTLTVRNSAGEDTERNVVQVTVPRPPPAAAFEVQPIPAERFAGSALTFTDRTDAARPLTTPVFTFPNGSLSPAAGQRSVQYTFAQAGTFPVSMRVCWADEPQNCNETQQTVTILQPATRPAAAFTLSGPGVINQSTIAAGRPVSFTDASTGANITRREWNIGGSQYDTTSVTLTLSTPGQLSVTLTVTNAGGSDAATRSIAVVAAPAASFDAPTAALTGVPITFTDTSTGFITSWTWDFGDGTTFTTTDPARRSPQHTYSTSGSYIVRLRVSNDADQSTATPRTINITVPVPPAPVIQATDPTTGAVSANGAISVRAGVAAQFIDASVGPPATSWVWQWGDGTPNSDGAQATHSFATPGSYTVKLIATNTGGSTEATLNVTVTPPVAAASTSTTSGAPAN